MMIEKSNAKAVNWILEFLADDLDSISDLDFSKRVLDAQYYFLDQWRGEWGSTRGLAPEENDKGKKSIKESAGRKEGLNYRSVPVS